MKEYPRIPLSDKWMKAAVVGSLWAAVEIVLGSLLHNLRIPFAGSSLSFFTVYLVISFFQIWNINGLIWRAGLICALMKSISPSAIILGPMIGILSQAFILELFIRLAGKNLFSYAAGGALAVFSALLQKVLTLLILYGWDLISLLENIYILAMQQIGWANQQPIKAVLGLSLIYLLSGALAGYAGYRAGNRFIANQGTAGVSSFIKTPHSDLFKHSGKKRHSVLFLFFHIVLLFAGMIIISQEAWTVSLPFVFSFVLMVFLRYPSNVRFLKKPGLWLQFAVIILLSALFRNGTAHLLQSEGLWVGIRMSMRALMVFCGFAAISAELKNPLIKNLLYNKGFRNLYLSVDLAFSALPAIMEGCFKPSDKPGAFRKLTYRMLNSAQHLLADFKRMEENHRSVFILTGTVNQGKTSLAADIISRLQSKGYVLQGFLSPHTRCKDDISRYYIEDINSGERTLLCTDVPDHKKLNFGRFYFEPAGINAGCEKILRGLESPPDLLVIDELGPLEMNDMGWAPAIAKHVEKPAGMQLWVVRSSLLKPMMRKWKLGDVVVFRVGEDTAESIVETISKRLGSTPTHDSPEHPFQ